MRVLTAADFADTGQWRLKIYLYNDGLTAYLENTIHDDIEPQLLAESHWDAGDDLYLKNLEEAIYSNPRLLDDFATRIVIFDRNTLFIPSQVVEDEDSDEEEIYTEVFAGEPQDVLTDRGHGIIASWNPGKGIKSFLMRTFPGSVITSNLMQKVKEKLDEAIPLATLHVDVRKDESDFIFTEDDQLLGAVTQSTGSSADVVYHLLNLTDIYRMKPDEVAVVWRGEQPGREAEGILKHFRDYIVF